MTLGAQVIQDLFACPACRGPLTEADDVRSCASCGKSFSVSNGLSVFDEAPSTHGEFSEDEMAELLALAERDGWKTALDSYAKSRRAFVLDLLMDSRREKVVEPLAELGCSSVLDLGCGYGGLSMQLARKFENVVSLDGSKQRVSFLNLVRQQEGLDNVTPVCHDGILNLPFQADRFDAIVLVGVFEYLPISLPDMSIHEAHRKCLAEFRRILKPGGHLLIASKNRFGWQYLTGAADHSGIRFAPAMPRPLANLISRMVRGKPYRIINYSPSGYRRLVEKAGFCDSKLYWTVPGYQAPDHVVQMDGEFRSRVAALPRGYFSTPKRIALDLLARVGLLKHIVPFPTVVARKQSKD